MTILPLDFGGPTDRPFTPFPASALEDSILDRFRAIALRHAGRLAIDDGHQRLTYGEVRARVERLAGLLMTGLPPGADPVAIFLDHYASFPIAMLAVLAAGRAYVPLDVSFPLERNRRILQHASSAAIVTDHANALLAAKLCLPGTPLIDMDALDAIETPIPQMPTADSLAYILYTSGSTGEPKGVYQNHRNLLHDVLQYTNSIHLSTEDRLTMLYSGCVGGAIRDIYGALLNGASLHILPFRQLGAMGLVAAIAEHGITIYHSVPTVFRQLVAALRTHQRLSDIRLAYLAGDRLDRADVDALRRHFPRDALLYTGIGSTENATLYRHWFIASDTPMEGPRVPVGRAIPDRDMALLDERGTPVPEGETGEIQVTSRYLALGYWRAPELTRMAFSEAPHDPRARVFRTGDLGRLRPDGLLEFMGRKDHQVKIRGFRVELGAIEAALKQASWIRDAAVMAHEDRSGDQRLVAYVVADPTHYASLQSLRQALKLQLPDHMIPTTVKVLECLPLTPNGKLDRHALPIPAGPNRMPQDPLSAAPRTPLEARLVSFWQDVLGLVDPPGIHDDFFDLGGHSLLAARLVQVIETDLRMRLPLAALFRFSTIAQLAERFSEQAPESAPTEQRPPSVLATTLQETVYRALLTFRAGRKHPRLAPDSLLMRLNPEASGTPLYFCGIFEALAAALPHRPIIAMDSGLYAMAITDANVQALAQHYFEEIQARQLIGPFVLIGFSLGAQVAFKLARLLISGGHAVTLLGLIDKSIEHPYPGRVAQFIADQGPFRHLPDSDTWRQDCAQRFPGGMSLDRIPGNHTSILRQGAVAHLLAERIEARLAQLTATAVPLSAEARRLTWQAPAKLVYAMDETASLLLVLTNASPLAWGNDHALSVGYHWYDDYARLVQWAVDTVPLSLPINAGQSISLSIPVAAPGRPGRYRLVVDLLDRAESWGMLSGLETAAVAVEILPASQPKCSRATDLDEARLAWQEGRDQDTMRLCQPLLTAHDQAPLQVFQQLALALQRWGRLEASLDVCQRGLTAYPNDAQLRHLCAEVALGLDQPNLAVEHACRATELEPARPVHWALLGQACAKRGDDAQAIDAYRRALAQRADIDWRKGLAECLERTGHFSEAATEWRHAIALRPGQLTFSVRLARALRQAGQPDAALDVCRQLLDQDPGHLESHLFIMDGLRELGRAAEALALYDAASPRLKPSARLQQAYGDCLIALERTEEALAAFRRGTEIDPAFAGNWLKLADTWLQQPSIEAAEHVLDSALGHHPDDVRFLFRRGQLLLDQGHEASEALAMFDRVIAQQPTHFRAHWRRAEALVKLKRWTEAEAAYRCAAVINPRHGPVRQGLVRVGEQLNALETAR